MVKIGELYADTKNRFEAAGVYDSEYEATELLVSLLGPSRAELMMLPSRHIDEETLEALENAVIRRESGIPLQYILGEWEFYGLPFYVGEGVLIPRPETELLVDLAAKHLNKASRLLDLCAGSGCIGIAASAKSGCEAVEAELYEKAYEYLLKNIERNKSVSNVRPMRLDVLSDKSVALLRESGHRFDAIVTNPPYLTAEEMDSLQKEVAREPETALFGGNDGLDFYRVIFKLWTPLLNNGGLFAAEVGDGQAESVCGLMREAGLSPEILNDLNGIARVCYAVIN